MKLRNPRIPAQALVAALVFAAGVCGASPQQEGDRRERPHPQGPVGRTLNEGPRPTNPMPMDGGTRHTRQPFDDGNRRPTPMPRVRRVDLYPGTRTVVPPAWQRCTVQPTVRYWRGRDLMAEIQGLARRGFIPVSALGDGVDVLTDFAQTPAGWRAYGLAVPAGGTVQFEVQHPKLAWFRLMLVDKWGQPGPGMLQAAIAHQPVLVTYRNPNREAAAVYVIVDDPGWWSDARDPYTLVIRRDWNPAQADVRNVKIVAGLWGASPSVSAQFGGPSLTGPAVFPH